MCQKGVGSRADWLLWAVATLSHPVSLPTLLKCSGNSGCLECLFLVIFRVAILYESIVFD